jgi:molybdopterin-guanine dinucleotide biosynthesis protein A
MAREVVGGIFVGGASRRMGRPKGLVSTGDGRTLIERARALFDELGMPVVLVGRRPEYTTVELPQLHDDPPGVGPLGGLAALLTWAGERRALALACDMPFVERADLEVLLAAPPSPNVAPRRDGRWEPLCARYEPRAVLPVLRRELALGRRSLQGLLDAAEAREVALPPAHLDDWDSPEDVERSAS